MAVGALGLAAILIFAFTILALAAELAYVLWYRRRFRREAPGADDPEVAGGDAHGSPNSKELLLYFLCLKDQSPNDRASAVVVPVYSFDAATPGLSWPGYDVSHAKFPPPHLPPPPPLCELAMWRGLYAPKVPFAIGDEEEEEEEEVGGSEPDGWVFPISKTWAARRLYVVAGGEKEVVGSPQKVAEEGGSQSEGGMSPGRETRAARRLDDVAGGEKGAAGKKEVVGSPDKVAEEEGFEPDGWMFPGSETWEARRLYVFVGGEKGKEVVGFPEMVAEEAEGEFAVEPVSEFTPFSTPCDSSPFYTPPPSPRRGLEADWDLERQSLEADGSGSDDEEFFSSEDKLPAE